MTPSDLATWEALAACAANDFEGVIAVRHPEVARYVDALRDEGAVPALMTGSGSTVYGVLDDAAIAANVAERLEDAFAAEGVRAVVTQTAERVERVLLSG
jgi:4-diphosphocytidyl-2C-methyl-D-erythritol kinase